MDCLKPCTVLGIVKISWTSTLLQTKYYPDKIKKYLTSVYKFLSFMATYCTMIMFQYKKTSFMWINNKYQNKL